MEVGSRGRGSRVQESNTGGLRRALSSGPPMAPRPLRPAQYPQCPSVHLYPPRFSLRNGTRRRLTIPRVTPPRCGLPFFRTHVLFFHPRPYAVSRNLGSSALEGRGYPRLINTQKFRGCAPAGRALAIRSFIEERRISSCYVSAVPGFFVRQRTLLHWGPLPAHSCVASIALQTDPTWARPA